MTGFLPTGQTRVFPVLGDPIGQVSSPARLTEIFVASGSNDVVVPMHVVPRDLHNVMDTLFAVRNVGGVLLTIPHKFAAMESCHAVSERARFVSSTNVVRKTPDGWFGENTDGRGFADGLERCGFAVAGKTVLLVGCGGAGSAIAYELLDRGAARLDLHDTDAGRVADLKARLERSFSGKLGLGTPDPSHYDLVCNASPMGMKADDPLPVDVDRLSSDQFVACVVTKPAVPRLIRSARERGCRTMTGGEMFDAQAQILANFLAGASME